MSNFTDTKLRALQLKPGQLQLRVWDDKVKGLGIVIGKKVRTFVIYARVDGERIHHPIGAFGQACDSEGHTWNVERARKQAHLDLGQLAAGINPKAERKLAKLNAGGPTVRDALEAHITKMLAGENRRQKVCSPRSIATLRGFVELHLAEYLDGPLIALTADVITDLRNKLEKGKTRRADANPTNPGGRANSNRLVQMVKTLWRSWDKPLPVPNPTEKMKLRALAERDTRVNNADLPGWYAKLHAMKPADPDGNIYPVMNPIRRDLQLVSIFTGVRADGVRNLRWDDIDFEDELLHIAKAKGDKPYTLPMTATVREVLERRQTDNASSEFFAPFGGDHGFVFPSLSRDGKTVIALAEPKERKIKRDLKGLPVCDDEGNAIRESYLPGTHVNRRTFNSIAIEIGIPPEPRETLMNHEGRGVNVKHYGQPQNWDYLRTCADQIEAALWSRIRGEQKPKKARALRLVK